MPRGVAAPDSESFCRRKTDYSAPTPAVELLAPNLRFLAWKTSHNNIECLMWPQSSTGPHLCQFDLLGTIQNTIFVDGWCNACADLSARMHRCRHTTNIMLNPPNPTFFRSAVWNLPMIVTVNFNPLNFHVNQPGNKPATQAASADPFLCNSTNLQTFTRSAQLLLLLNQRCFMYFLLDLEFPGPV